MTREEIINEIKPILEELNYPDAVSYIVQNDRRWLEENIRALEQEPFINKVCVSSGACEHDKNKVLDKIRAEIFEEYRNESEHPYGQGLRRAIEIIDKYKAESEG